VTQAIFVARALVALLALVGVAANLAIASDVQRNRRASRLLTTRQELSASALADLEDTARIDIRGASASAGAHAMFLVLGLIEIGLPVPSGGSIHVFGLLIARQALALGFAILWDGIQAVVVGAQVRNQFARVGYRSRARPKEGD
jgi:hypothetical protein